MISDVPVGIFLSGGLDSSSLVALAREVSSQRIQTFSIGFDVPSYDELTYSRLVARRFGTEHREMIVRPDVAELLPMLVRYLDEPFADSSAIPLFCVSRLARQHVKVTLSGEGGDEVFAGYQTYAAHRIAALYQGLPDVLARQLIPAAVRLLPLSDRKVSFDYKAKRFVGGALLPPDQGHYWWKVILSEDAKAALYAGRREGLEDPFRLYRVAYQQCDAGDTLTRLQHIDLSVYLPDDILVKADRMTMANSIEGRVPFLDHRVVEFAAALPPRLKMRGLTKKYILRRVMARHLPSRVLHGKKRGFNVPIGAWLRRELRVLVHEVLEVGPIREMGLFRPEAITRLVREHEERQVDHSRPIWGLVMLGLWWQQYGRETRGRCERDTVRLATATSA